MFVTKKQFNREISTLADRLDRVNNLYWHLSHAHDRLLEHLRLHEVTIPARKKLVEIQDVSTNHQPEGD